MHFLLSGSFSPFITFINNIDFSFHLKKGLGVTHAMEKSCIAALRKLKVEVIVAPYEADPQLAYLCHIGYCKGVLSEDSDILMYSAACGTPFPILYKYDPSIGSVQVTDIAKLGILPGQSPAGTKSSQPSADSTKKPSKLSQVASNFSNANGTRMFVQLCLLAGCDYCESIHGVGIITALQVLLALVGRAILLNRSYSHIKFLTGSYSLRKVRQ